MRAQGLGSKGEGSEAEEAPEEAAGISNAIS